ncbi:Uncharacterised protein [Scardovia inopinata]|uniref:DUF4097 domain-containing protein n=1 Tax=Scardovia inopinata F0304 TaxID=641146 RepID=W5IK10_SCAIO|nr:hypothetical protein HMPREF9020_00841 [Scardovia inopinata F0304]BAR06813.1 hypothetical protein SCIP_0746 [Scardovia inopinata JCM 12537]SUV50874.1 Uncharacterised protein [Scardovia inopinata]
MSVSDDELRQTVKLTVNAKAMDVIIRKGESPAVDYENCGPEDFDCVFDQGKLKIKLNDEEWKRKHPQSSYLGGHLVIKGVGHGGSKDKIYKITLTLPTLERIKIKASASTVTVSGQTLQKARVRCDASKVKFVNTQARTIDFTVNAGKITARDLNLEKDSTFEANAGKIKLTRCLIPEAGYDIHSVMSTVTVPGGNGSSSGHGHYVRKGSPVLTGTANLASVSIS